MAKYYLRISAAERQQLSEAEQLANEAVDMLGCAMAPKAPDARSTKNILDTGLSPEFFIGLPAGIVVGMVANEIHRRLIAWSGVEKDVVVTTRGTDTVITDQKTGLQIILRPLNGDETSDAETDAGDLEE